jgi:hypothetical protein
MTLYTNLAAPSFVPSPPRPFKFEIKLNGDLQAEQTLYLIPLPSVYEADGDTFKMTLVNQDNDGFTHFNNSFVLFDLTKIKIPRLNIFW